MSADFKSLRQCLILLATVILIIVVLDETIGALTALLYHNNHWTWGSIWPYSSGLSFMPSLNPLWEELWFAETIAFIVMPFILWARKRRVKAPLLPWILVALWMAWGLAGSLETYTHPVNSGLSPPNLTYQIHSGTKLYYSHGPEFDRSLESELPYYLVAQIIPFAIIGAGYFISYQVLSDKTHKR